jgi:hypothetical protein
MASHLAFQLVALGVQDDPVSLEGVAGRVMHPGTSGYYAEALRVGQAERWLESYPRLLPSFHLHGRTKPPGPILFHRAFQKALGEGPRAAQAAGLAIGLLATLSIPASFLLIRLLTASEEAAFAGASFLALCPGPILFFPQLDQVYPVVSCALVGCWVLALATQRIRYACAFGLVSSLALFFSYSLLTLGVVLGLFTLASVQRRRSLRFAVAGSAAALGSLCAVYAAVFGATGFDPIETFRTAVANQAAILPRLGRPYPGSIPFDLLDFALGAGWISAPLVAFFLFDGGAGAGAASRRAAIFGLVQIVGLALTGLVQTETARVWQFLLPLFLCPVGCELAAWRPAQRNSVYACLWLVTTTICRNMRFQ